MTLAVRQYLQFSTITVTLQYTVYISVHRHCTRVITLALQDRISSALIHYNYKMSSSGCPAFNSEVESVLEFMERFKVQNADLLQQAGDDAVKKASLLVKALPVSVITDLQRRIKPTKLSEAT